jgi:hypothetical protein
MTVMNDEDPADPSVHEPRVTGSPEAIWLVYGELEHDDTHAELCSHEGVTWCEDAQFAADVRYTRKDLVAERLLAAVAAERERCAKLCDLHSRLTWNDDRQTQSRVLAAEIRRGPNVRAKPPKVGLSE